MTQKNNKSKVSTSPKPKTRARKAPVKKAKPIKKVTAKKTTPKAKVEKLEVIDGKQKEIQKIKELEEILGTAEVNAFGTNSMEVLEDNLKGLTLADLQTFAVKVGVLPSGNKTNLKNKIFKTFRETPGAGAGYNVGAMDQPIVDPNSDIGKKALKAIGDLF